MTAPLTLTQLRMLAPGEEVRVKREGLDESSLRWVAIADLVARGYLWHATTGPDGTETYLRTTSGAMARIAAAFL